MPESRSNLSAMGRRYLGPVITVSAAALLYYMQATPFRWFLCLGALYTMGLLPVPSPFRMLYKLYCSELVGYWYIRPLLHARQPRRHSEYWPGVRSLSGAQNTFMAGDMPTQPQSTVELLTAMYSDSQKGVSSDAIVIPLPVLQDNYAYAIISPCNRPVLQPPGPVHALHVRDIPLVCTLIDAADPCAIVSELEKLLDQVSAGVVKQQEQQQQGNNVTSTDTESGSAPTRVRCAITHIFTTHKHWDHAGGNKEWRDLSLLGASEHIGPDMVIPALPLPETTPSSIRKPLKDCDDSHCVYISTNVSFVGSTVDRPMCTNTFLKGGDTVLVSPTVTIAALESPGHTVGSLTYVAALTSEATCSTAHRAVFTGDCIFCGGCGAQFEARNATDVLESYDIYNGPLLTSGSILAPAGDTFSIPPENVYLYVGHEYTDRLFLELMRKVKVEQGNNNKKLSPHCAAIAQRHKELKLLRVTAGERACTVPSPLHIERRVNPLLSLQRDVLEELQKKGAEASEIESTVYTSDKRREE